MSSRSLLASLAFLGALSFILSPSLACERHQSHQASIAGATPAAPPAPATIDKGIVLISPAAEAAMSVTEALVSEPTAMRCRRMQKIEQALTQ